MAVVHLGLAEGRARLALERVALNVMDYRIADNSGYRAEGQPRVPEGPAADFATLPLPEILAALTAEGVPAYVSNTAGTFLCNQTLYATLHEIAMRELDRPGGVHPPPAPARHGRRERDRSAKHGPRAHAPRRVEIRRCGSSPRRSPHDGAVDRGSPVTTGAPEGPGARDPLGRGAGRPPRGSRGLGGERALFAPTDPAAGVLAAGRYAGISGAPAFLQIHELQSDDANAVAASERPMSDASRARARRRGDLPRRRPRRAGRGAPGLRWPRRRLRPHLPARDRRAGGRPWAAAGAPDRTDRYPARARGRVQRVVQHRVSDRQHDRERGLLGAPPPEPRAGASLPHRLRVRPPQGEPGSPAWDRARAQSVWRRRIERLWAHAPGSPGIYRRLAAR